MNNCVKSFLLLAACFSVTSLAGCGGSSDQPELGNVTGIVTLDGKPVIGVNVVFKPDIGRAAAGNTDQEGKFTLEYLAGEKGCKLGPNSISFDWPPGAQNAVAIPAKYSGAEQFTFEVKAGSNTCNLKLESDGTEAVVPVEE